MKSLIKSLNLFEAKISIRRNIIDGRKTLNYLIATVLLSTMLPSLVFGQASTIVSEREPIVVYDEKDLNPKKPDYEWTGATLLNNIRVIDGMGNPAKEGQDVLVSDGKIQAVGPTGKVKAPDDAKVIDGKGLTVLPGLIDAHIHLQGGWRGANDNGTRPATLKWDMLTYLYNGITTVYDIGNIPTTSADARDIVAAGGWMGPEIIIAGTYFETASVGASGVNTLLPTPDSTYIGGQLDAMKDIYGVEMVKCHTGINSQILRILVKEAHARDMRVVCDLWHNNGNPWIARQTHLDGYAHNTFMAVPPSAEAASMLADEGTFVISTIVLFDAFAGTRFKQEGIGYIKDNPLILDVQPPHYIEAHNNGGLEATLKRHSALNEAILEDVTPVDEMRKQSVDSIKILLDNGVLVGIGTDSGYPGVWFGESLHRELEIWVNESGISPIRTLQAVTHDNARILKIDDRTGSIKPGLQADLLVVEGNPSKNISDTRNIKYVFLNGKLLDRESLTRQWRY